MILRRPAIPGGVRVKSVVVQRVGGSESVMVILENWRRIIHLGQWGGWHAPLDHWDFSEDANGARSFADAVEGAVRQAGDPPRSAAEVALQILDPLGLAERDALEEDAAVGLALFEARSHLRDFFVQEYDALVEDCAAVVSLARGGPFRVTFAT
jgi:hypothetical protein